MKHTKATQLAEERIHRLFELAEQELGKKPERSKRYVHIARELSKKHRVRMSREMKKKFCKKCGAYLKKGKNSETKTIGTLTIVKCIECGFERKTGDKPKQ